MKKDLGKSCFLYCDTVEHRYNEGQPRDWQNMFAITRFRYIGVLFHIWYYFTKSYHEKGLRQKLSCLFCDTVEPRYNEGMRDEVSLYRGLFPYILLLLE